MIKKSAVLALSLFIGFSYLLPSSVYAFYSKDAYEAHVTFNGRVQVVPGTAPEYAMTYIQQQMDWLAGPLQGAAQKAGPKNDAQITHIQLVRDNQGHQFFAYTYSGTMVLAKTIREKTLSIYLPVDPTVIYERSSSSCYMFPDHTYAYYWNPMHSGCNLTKDVDYMTLTASVEPMPNTQNTYPDYERLVTPNGDIRATIVFGADQDQLGMLPPDGNKDYNATNFLKLRSYLSKQGFQRHVITKTTLASECGKSLDNSGGYVEEFTRNDRRPVSVRIFWGVANLGDESAAFYCTMKSAAESGSIFLYNGHSRVGGLDLQYMSYIIQQPLRLNPSQYQIFGFFGCSSYDYYNYAYAQAKASPEDPTGTQNLKIITNGMIGNFETMDDMTEKTLAPMLLWAATEKKTSWQQIIDSYSGSYLTGINGD